MTYDEAGKVLGVSPRTVEVQLRLVRIQFSRQSNTPTSW